MALAISASVRPLDTTLCFGKPVIFTLISASFIAWNLAELKAIMLGFAFTSAAVGVPSAPQGEFALQQNRCEFNGLV